MGLRNFVKMGHKSAPPSGEGQITLVGSLEEILQQIADGGDTGLGLSSNYRSQLMDGYAANPYVAKCVHLRASAVAALEPIVINKDDKVLDSHPLIDILRRPNPRYSWEQMIYEVAGDIAMSGNGYFEPISTVRGVSELWYARAGDVTPIPKADRYYPVAGWIVTSHGTSATLEPEDLIHIVGGKRGPDDILGIAPLASARLSIVQQTMARRWNVSLMKHGAKPSIVIQSPQKMSPRDFELFSSRLNSKHAGTDNAGSTMVLDDGKTISTAGFNARDMDYAVGVTTSAREISVALGVPPELVGDSANKTYANAQEANREFALQTVIPDADRIYKALTRRLCVGPYADVRITYDRQQIEALRGSEIELLTALQGATFLTTNEKRARLSYDDIEGGDAILVPMGQIPLDEAVSPVELPPVNPPGPDDDTGSL